MNPVKGRCSNASNGTLWNVVVSGVAGGRVSLLLIIHVAHQEALAQIMESVAASGLEFGNGKN